MSDIKKEVQNTTKKIMSGSAEEKIFGSLEHIWDLISEDYLLKDDLDQETVRKMKETFGNSFYNNPKEYVKLLVLELRKELAKEHTIVETFKIFVTLQDTLRCKLVRVSKKAPNYENVKIARAFYKHVKKTATLPTDLFEPLEML